MSSFRPANGTMVRLVADCVDHCANRKARMRGDAPTPGKRMVGQMIPICLPPVPPDHHWRCDTPWVWQVQPEFLRRLGVDPDDADRIFVCVHAIEGD